MRIALAQMAMDASMDDNFAASLRLLGQSAREGADLVCFPEIQLSPFFPQRPDADARPYLMPLDSPYIAKMQDACRKFGIFAAPNFYLNDGGCAYDTSLLIDDAGQLVGTQKMVHIAQAPQFYEQSYYTPSNDGFKVFDTRFGTIGIVVCFDRHYPESIRTEALMGADLILVPTANTTAEPAELFDWEVRVQAFQNSVNIAMCNRTGVEEDMAFSGRSLVADFNGDVVAQAGAGEQLLYAEVDLPAATRARGEKPYTQLRRCAFYL